jgi:hypothetical protein
VLPPPDADHPRVAHLSFLNELAVAGASSSASFEVESVDCDFDSRFMAFVLKKISSRCGQLDGIFPSPCTQTD